MVNGLSRVRSARDNIAGGEGYRKDENAQDSRPPSPQEEEEEEGEVDQRYAPRPQQGKVRVRDVRQQEQQGELVKSQENQES